MTHWGKDPHIGMSYSFMRLGASGNDYDEMSRSVDNRLYFAGEVCINHRLFKQYINEFSAQADSFHKQWLGLTWVHCENQAKSSKIGWNSIDWSYSKHNALQIFQGFHRIYIHDIGVVLCSLTFSYPRQDTQGSSIFMHILIVQNGIVLLLFPPKILDSFSQVHPYSSGNYPIH